MNSVDKVSTENKVEDCDVTFDQYCTLYNHIIGWTYSTTQSNN